MSGGIFISYRRGDDRHAAGRLYLYLEKTFAPEQLFMDVDGIEPGLDFVKVLNEKVGSCNVLLALIGRGWLSARERLNDPRDFVRLEIEAALKRDIRVVPVLIDGLDMVGADMLPETLKPLAHRHAIKLSHDAYAAGVSSLVKVLEKDVAPAPAKRGWFQGWSARRAQPQKTRTEAAPSAKPVAVASMPAAAEGQSAAPPPNVLSGILSASPARAPILVALAFAVLAPLLTINGLFGDNGMAVAAAVALALAVGWAAWSRTEPISGTERGLYWLGAAATGVITLGLLFRTLGLTFFSYSDRYVRVASGVLAGSILTLVSARLMALRRGREIEGTEAGLYWLGSALAVCSGIGAWIDGTRSWDSEPVVTTAVSPLFVIWSLVRLRRRRARLTGPEATIYWLGGSIAMVLFLGFLNAHYLRATPLTGGAGSDGMILGAILSALVGLALRRSWMRGRA